MQWATEHHVKHQVEGSMTIVVPSVICHLCHNSEWWASSKEYGSIVPLIYLPESEVLIFHHFEESTNSVNSWD